MMSENHNDTYNGWANYETWLVALWLDNNEASQTHWKEVASETRKDASTMSQVIDEIWTLDQAARFTLADNLEGSVLDASSLADENSLYSDLLKASLSKVNWREIAASWLDDIE